MTLPPVLQQPLTLPVIASPLFLASGPELVLAQCRAGVVGAFPALNARPAELLSDWLDELNEKLSGDPTAAPFAVNQIVHRSNNRLEQDMQVIVDHQVPIVITSLGARPEINEAVHSYGGIVLHDITTNRFAHKAIEKGADGLIAVAAGAGGHAGSQSPLALVREIREWFDGPLALSGAITHGQSILAAQAMGADFAYIGSAFLATKESNAPEPQKQLIYESSAEDIVYSNLFTGVHGNYLRGSISASGLDPDNLAQSSPSAMSFASGDGNTKAWRDIWGSGQGIATITGKVTTQELVDRLKREYDLAREELALVLSA